MSYEFYFLLSYLPGTMMTGIIWFVQINHYPSFSDVSEKEFRKFHDNHMKKTGYIVGPLMLAELFGSLGCLIFPPPQVEYAFLVAAFCLVALIWLSTALIQVPLHRSLSDRYSSDAVIKLVLSNWIRTGAWSLKSLILTLILL